MNSMGAIPTNGSLKELGGLANNRAQQMQGLAGLDAYKISNLDSHSQIVQPGGVARANRVR